jgi:signal transduction histidine kinase/CheY-like chemotaxis protein
MPTDTRAFAHSLRTVALVAAGASALWEVMGSSVPVEHLPTLLAVRAGTAVLGLAVALASTPRRSVRALHAFAYLLALAIVVSNAVAVTLGIPQPFEFAAVLAVTMLGAAVFLPWTPRAQTALSVPAALSYPLVLLLLPPSAIPPAVLARGSLLVATAALASILGARLVDRARRQLAAAEVDRRAGALQQAHEGRLDAVSRLAGGMAHQFNNLLAGILTHVETLLQDASTERVTTELTEIADAAKRGRALTDELLRFTRSEPLSLQPTDTARALASIERLAHAFLPPGATVQLVAPPPGGLPPIRADLDHLVLAGMQLAVNARDAMEGRPNPRLTLTAAEETLATRDPRWPDVARGRYVRISMTDTGRGMDQATLERVFEPFFTTKPMHEATGLGLAIVNRVMRDHRGAVRIESEPGRGTSVHLLIPVSTEPVAAAGAPAQAAGAAPAPQGATILVVDDEPIVRNSLRRALTRFGHRVLEAGDGPTALAALGGADPPVELIILDLVLPGGGAGIFELLKAVRPDVKVIVSSGYSPDGEASRGLASRVEGFLPKPYELAQLRAAVTNALTSRD